MNICHSQNRKYKRRPITLSPEEYRATVTGNMYRECRENRYMICEFTFAKNKVPSFIRYKDNLN